jgi:poly(A) polymerase
VPNVSGKIDNMTTEREFALDVVRQLRNAGFEALWAGGCVRDELLGLEPHDYDVATNARPEEVQALFRRTIAMGASFGVIEVIGPRIAGEHLKVQVATFRIDGPYEDSRRPASVRFCSAQEDALRRDFTINGMFFDPVESRVIDYVGGADDLKAKILRAIGNPHERFTEDKLRLLRAVRFAARFELNIDATTAEAARAMAGQITLVAAERIAEELRKLLTNKHRVRGIQLMTDMRLVDPILTELQPLLAPPGEQWQHTLKVLQYLPEAIEFPLGMGTLLLECAQPETVACECAEHVCDRLKLANAERDRICWLVEKCRYLDDAPAMRKSDLKMILIHPGIHDLFLLHRAIAKADGQSTAHVDFCEQRLREWSAAGTLNPPPHITGDDLIRMGLRPGKEFRMLLEAVRRAQLEEEINTREQALELVQRLRKQ